MNRVFLLFCLEGALATNVTFTTGEGTTSDTCPNITVTDDVTTGWYDACVGLTKYPDKGTEAACAETCTSDMTCSVWQLVKNGADDTPTCYSGSVYHGCLARGGSASDSTAVTKFEGDLIAGQHIQHGFIKVVSTNTAETVGLRHFVEKTGTPEEQMARCKKICYTDATCTVWQFGSDGCWFEHLPDHPKKEQKPDSEWSKGMLGGETIEHECPPYVAPEGLPWPWIITGIVLGLLALAAIVYALTKKPKVKKTRAVKIQPKPDPAPVVPLFIPQPTVLIPQQTMIMAPPPAPVTYQTVQAAPTTSYVTQAAAPVMTEYVTQAQPLLSGGMVQY